MANADNPGLSIWIPFIKAIAGRDRCIGSFKGSSFNIDRDEFATIPGFNL